MTNEIKNVPELRFSGFKDEWRILKLGDSAIIKGRLGWKGLKQEEYVNNGHAFLVANKHINNGKVNWKKADQINQFRYEESLEIALQKGDLIFSKDGALGNPAIINELPKYATINSTMMLVRPYKEKLNSLFFYQILLSSYFNKLIHLKVSGSSIPHLFQADMKDFNFFTPKLEEQKKIGDFFSKLDRQIELEEQKLEKLEEQKKGYMQKIFSQELRFKDENGNTFEEWKNTNFNYFMSEPDNLEKGIDLRKDQLLTVKLEGNGVSKANINRALKMGSTVYYKRFAGQFIYGKQNFFNGAFGIVPKFLNNYYSSGDVPALNIDYRKIDSKYFINYISRKDYYKKKEAFSTGTGSKRIHEKTLLDFDIMLPSVEEQEKIGGFFSEIDNFIEKQSYKVELLKERKKGFLQKMFV